MWLYFPQKRKIPVGDQKRKIAVGDQKRKIAVGSQKRKIAVGDQISRSDLSKREELFSCTRFYTIIVNRRWLVII